MDAAFEIGLAQPDLSEPRPHRFDMALLAAVRGAGERDVLVAQPELLDRTAFDEGHGLDRLVGRTRQDGRIDVAPGRHDRAVRLDDGGDPLVPAFDDRSPRHLDDHRALAHHPRSSFTTVTLSWCSLAAASTVSIRPPTDLMAAAAISAALSDLHAVAAQQQPGVRAELAAALVDQGQRIAHDGLTQRVAAGMTLRLIGRQHAALDHGVDLRRHRMVGVQPHELAGRHAEERRIADADPAHLVAAHLRRHQRGAHAGEVGLGHRALADGCVGVLQPVGQPAALLHGMDEGLDRELAGDRAARMSAHAVRHDGQQRTVGQARSAQLSSW